MNETKAGVYRPLMKLSLCCILVMIAVTGFSQSIKSEPNANSNRSRLLRADQVSISVTANQAPSLQAKAWKEETTANPQNAAAWLNYYLWTSRDKTVLTATKEKTLTQIAIDAEQHAAASAPVLLIRYLHSGKKDSAALYQVFERSEDKSLIYPYLIQHAIIKKDKSALARHAAAFNQMAPLSAALKEYYYNVLMSADSNATIYAQGLNDLVSLAMLHVAHGVRKDIRLNDYAGNIAEKNSYLCLSIGKEALQKLSAAVYSGLLVQVAGSGDLNQLRHNLEEKFSLTVLDNAVTQPADVALLYRNYLPSFILLYKYLKNNKDASALKWEARILKIARWSGNEEAIKNLLTN